MSYWDLTDEDVKERGLDWDITGCLDCNPQSFTVDDIAKVNASWEGERDGDDWRWLLTLKDGRFVFMQGGCDFTGWDCQSNAWSTTAPSLEEAAESALSAENEQWNKDEGAKVRDELLKQLRDGRSPSWREAAEQDLGLRK